MTVYVIKEPNSRRDITNAQVFGEVKICLEQRDERLQLGMVLNRLRSALRDYGPGDYILWAGGEWPLLFACGMVLRELNVKHVDLLVWMKMNDGESTYVPRRMVI